MFSTVIIQTEVDPNSFALLMSVVRNSLGLTQEAFGKKLGISRANVCNIKKVAISQGFKLSLDFFTTLF
jgi:DNA-binding XRE family transcriptional regulator